MKILNLDNWCDEATAIVQEIAEVHTRAENFCKYDGVITNLQTKDLLYHELGSIKFVASCTTGLDHLPLNYIKERGFKVISLQGETDFLQDVWATAEHTWALIMSLVRKVPWAFNDVKQGNWNREAWQGTELRGKTLGIVGGLGRVGKQVCNFALNFGMKTLWIDKETYSQGIGNEIGNKSSEEAFEYLLRNSDIVTVHVPLNEQTEGMFSFRQFHQMKPTAYFINTSRGAIVNDTALEHALIHKGIAGAAVDVRSYEDKPIYDVWLSHINKYDNFIVTPHIAGNTAESRKTTQLFIAEKIKQFVERQGG